MHFEKGQSGNPTGRPRGARNRMTMLMQELLEEDAEAIARKLIELAKDGDIAALRMCLDRLAPARKGEAIAFELPSLGKAADAVSAAAKIGRGRRRRACAVRSRRPRQGGGCLRAGIGDRRFRGALGEVGSVGKRTVARCRRLIRTRWDDPSYATITDQTLASPGANS